MNKAAFRGLFLAVLLVGAAARLGRLDLRPMHHDEANQAVKFGTLLEKGEYRYDPADHHGPTLYYLTLPAAWARGEKTLAALDETTLRLIPALFGIGFLLLLLLLKRELGRPAVLLGALFAAFSPALTYYSRFYIQESLFVFFSLFFMIALGKYVLRPGAGWAAAAGISAGLMFATKETAVILFIAAGAGLLLARFASKERFRPPRFVHIAIAAAAAVAVAFLLYSSFFKNPAGLGDAVVALKSYAARGMESGWQAKPWWYYLRLLSYPRLGRLFWAEGLVFFLAVLGAFYALAKRRPVAPSPGGENDLFWPRYILFNSLIALAAFSLIPYKTPWNLLSFYAGFVIMAGFAAARLIGRIKLSAGRIVLLVLLFAGIYHMGAQNRIANRLYPADPGNPYAYAQTGTDFLRLVDRVRALSAIHPDGRSMLVEVVAGPYEQWPLPWYLRDFRRVGYWTDPAAAEGLAGAPIVIASEENAAKIGPILGDRYQSEFYGLRPGVLLAVFIEKTLWERFLERRNNVRF